MEREHILVRPNKIELLAGSIYLPFYMFLMQFILSGLLQRLSAHFPVPTGAIALNMAFQIVAALYLTAFMWKYLKESWFSFIRGGISGLWAILLGYAIRIIGAIPIAMVTVILFPDLPSPNNDAVIEMVRANFWPTFLLAVVFAPVVEELLFRGVLFAPLRKYGRILAYAVSCLAFALVHVLNPLLFDYSPLLFITALLYIPPGIALCWVYEKTGSIWAAIFLHALNNLIAMLLTLVPPPVMP